MSGGVPAGVNVTQDDRDAAADYFVAIGDPARAKVARRGEYDLSQCVQHFAAYRRRLAASPTPPIEGRDADVERVEVVAKTMFEASPYNMRTPWESVSLRRYNGTSDTREMYLLLARAALQALGERG